MIPATEPSQRKRTRVAFRGVGPVRTCTGCRQTSPQRELVRVVLRDAGQLVPDLLGSAVGRGAWMHTTPDCIWQAATRGLSRSFRAPVRTQPAELWQALRAAAHRHARALLEVMRRSGTLAVGSDAVQGALAASAASRIVVATDAGSAADAPFVARAVAEGRASAWGERALFSEITGRADAVVLALLDRSLAQEFARALAIVNLPAPPNAKRRVAEVATEEG